MGQRGEFRCQIRDRGGLFAPQNRIPEDAKAVLADKEQLARLRASCRSLGQMAAKLACSEDAVVRALRYHGIPTRRPASPRPEISAGPRRQSRGESALTPELWNLLVWRAYRRKDKCPARCPAAGLGCEEGECALDEVVNATAE